MDVSDQLSRRLRALTRAVSPEEIGELWIFPPLSGVEESAEFVLFTRRLEEDRRQVFSARVAPGRGNGHGPAEAAGRSNGGRPAAAGPSGGNGAGGAPDPDGAARGNGDGNHGVPGQVVTEHGSVPSGRVHRLVDRFRRRLSDDGEPLHVVIEGRRERWTDLLREG